MNRSSSRISILLAAALMALAICCRAYISLQARQSELNRIQIETDSLGARIEFSGRRLAALRADLHRENQKANDLLAGAMAGEGRLAQGNPDARWVEPPAELPAWSKESPFIWLRKEALRHSIIQIPTLNRNGQLPPLLCQVLDVTAGEKSAVETATAKFLSDFGDSELAAAKVTENHLNGVAGLPGVKVTVEIPALPEAVDQLGSQVAQTLRAELGEQRASIVLDWGQADGNLFNLHTAAPKIISVRREPGGMMYIATQVGGSLGGTTANDLRLEEHIPSSLLSLFQAVAPPPPDASSPGQPAP